MADRQPEARKTASPVALEFIPLDCQDKVYKLIYKALIILKNVLTRGRGAVLVGCRADEDANSFKFKSLASRKGRAGGRGGSHGSM